METLPFNDQDVCAAFDSCPNFNSAIKSFLKREVQKGDPLTKFSKTLREVFLSNQSERKLSFIAKHRPEKDWVFITIARYALYEPIAAITEHVIEKHAEEFNETYDVVEDSEIKVTDRAKFDSIVNDTMAMFRDGLGEHSLPVSNFMLVVLSASLFDDAVVPEVFAVVKAS